MTVIKKLSRTRGFSQILAKYFETSWLLPYSKIILKPCPPLKIVGHAHVCINWSFSSPVPTARSASPSFGVATSTMTAATGATRPTATGRPAARTSSSAPTASASPTSGGAIWKKTVKWVFNFFNKNLYFNKSRFFNQSYFFTLRL